MSLPAYQDIIKQLERVFENPDCPESIFVLFSRLREISDNICSSNPDLATAIIAPLPNVANGLIGIREGSSHYGHVITDAGLTCEGSFKSLYSLVLGKTFPPKFSEESISKEFENQTKYTDVRIKKILPTSWNNIYTIRNKKTAAHYGPISEHIDALFSIIGSIYILINHLEFLTNNFLAALNINLNDLNFQTILLETINEILLFPVIPTSLIRFEKDGPIIITDKLLNQQEAIGIILYALGFTKFEYNFTLLDELLKKSGHKVEHLSTQLSNMDTKKIITRSGDKIILTATGINWIQELIKKNS